MEILFSMAEINIAVVGFATLVAIFREKKESWKSVSWEFEDRRNIIRFMMMVELALFNVIFAYLPSVLQTAYDTDMSFQISAFLYALSTAGYFVFVHKRNRRLGGKKQTSDIKAKLIYVCCGMMITFALGISLGLWGDVISGQYLIIMMYLMILEFYFFIGLIHYSIPSPPDMEE